MRRSVGVQGIFTKKLAGFIKRSLKKAYIMNLIGSCSTVFSIVYYEEQDRG